MTSTADSARSSALLQFIRSFIHLIAVVAVTAWGFISWPLPWPGVLTGVGVLVLAVLLWALFLSPKPVLHVDRFAQSLFELLLLAAAAAVMFFLGWFWLWPVLLFVVGAVVGYLASARKA